MTPEGIREILTVMTVAAIIADYKKLENLSVEEIKFYTDKAAIDLKLALEVIRSAEDGAISRTEDGLIIKGYKVGDKT